MEHNLGETYNINHFKSFKFDSNKSETELSCINKSMVQVLDIEDEIIKKAIIEYAGEYAFKKSENIKLILLDEEKVKKIIDLGVNEYIKRRI